MHLAIDLATDVT